MSPLGLLEEGKSAEIVASGDSDCERSLGKGCLDHLARMGLRPGQRVEMLTNRGGGPLILRMDESRIALGRGMAMKIYIRRNRE